MWTLSSLSLAHHRIFLQFCDERMYVQHNSSAYNAKGWLIPFPSWRPEWKILSVTCVQVFGHALKEREMGRNKGKSQNPSISKFVFRQHHMIIKVPHKKLIRPALLRSQKNMAAILDTILGILGLFLRMGKVFEYFCCRCLVEFFCLKINERNVFFFF